MPRITQLFGILLILVGVVTWIVTQFSSWTALIPSIIGAILLLCGILAAVTKNQKLWVHTALVIAILGIAGTTMNVLKIGELFAPTVDTRPGAIVASTITFVALIVYLVLGVRSFITARRWRGQEG